MSEGEYLGIDCHTFRLPDDMWAGAARVPANAAYYQAWDGALNATSLSSFIPTFITTPRLASLPATSPVYPDLAVEHSPWAQVPEVASAWQVHPVSGLALHVSLASQANVYLSPFNMTALGLEGVDPVVFPDVWEGLLPLFWAQVEGGLNEQQALWVREMTLVEQGVTWAPWVMGALALLCGLATAWAALRWVRAVRGSGGRGKKAEKRKAKEEGLGERARLKVSGVWYGQSPQEATEVDEETSLDDADDEPEERLRIGYRY